MYITAVYNVDIQGFVLLPLFSLFCYVSVSCEVILLHNIKHQAHKSWACIMAAVYLYICKDLCLPTGACLLRITCPVLSYCITRNPNLWTNWAESVHSQPHTYAQTGVMSLSCLSELLSVLNSVFFLVEKGSGTHVLCYSPIQNLGV